MSTIITTWNGLENTKELVESIIKLVKEEYEIIFVDNGSTDGTIKYLKELEIKNKVIVHTEALGFSHAVNLGIKEASDKYPIVINNDVVITKDSLSNLRGSMERFTEYAIMASTTDNCGQILQWFPIKECVKPAIIDAPDVNFICFCIDKSFWEEHKLDEYYPFGVEDIDLCKTCYLNGRKVGVCLASFVHHKGSQTCVKEYGEEGLNKNLIKGWEYFAKKFEKNGGKERAQKYLKNKEKLDEYERQKNKL